MEWKSTVVEDVREADGGHHPLYGLKQPFVEPLVGSAVRTAFGQSGNPRWSARRTLHRFDEPIVEQPRAGVLKVGGGDEVIAHGGDEFGESGTV